MPVAAGFWDAPDREVARAALGIPADAFVALLVGGVWGFVVELDALQAGRAAVVIPVVLALHTVLPIACAPFLFGEALPGVTAERLLLGGGVLATLVGLCVIAVPSPRDEEKRKLPERDGSEDRE